MADITAKTTHDLWVESREFSLSISRSAPTSITITVTRPASLTVVDGAVVLLSTSPIAAANYPTDGRQYTPSVDELIPADRIVGVDGAHVVGSYSGVLGSPMPTGTLDAATGKVSFDIVVTNTDATKIYYASVHGVSNVLQYYPVGIQSYPIEGSRVEKGVEGFAGNIPSLPEAPVSPTEGFVYHDQQLNLFQYWTGTTWVPTRADTILTGDNFPGAIGYTYLLNAGPPRIFDGVKWVFANETNLQFRTGATWTPIHGYSAYTKLPEAPTIGDLIWNYTSQRGQYWDGAQWVYPGPSNSLFDTGTGLIPAFVNPLGIEFTMLPTPYVGLLFYNTTTKELSAWTGTEWRRANTDQIGSPISDKLTVGNDGSYNERMRLIKVLKSQLGWPQSCVELEEEQFNIAIDNALDNFRMWCDGAYRMKYVMFKLYNGQQTYYLNSQVDQTDKIVDVAKIHRLNILGIETANGNDAVWTSGILTSYYSAVSVDILSLNMLSMMSEEFQRLFAGDLTFLWDEPSRELFVTRKIYRDEKVIVECLMERTEQEILVDRWSKQFIQNWALAEAKYQLGMIRSRFSSGTPGAAGTITQNGELLITEARQDMTELKQSALDFEWGGHVGHGNVSFLFG
jgi:hypothetical protein